MSNILNHQNKLFVDQKYFKPVKIPPRLYDTAKIAHGCEQETNTVQGEVLYFT